LVGIIILPIFDVQTLKQHIMSKVKFVVEGEESFIEPTKKVGFMSNLSKA